MNRRNSDIIATYVEESQAREYDVMVHEFKQIEEKIKQRREERQNKIPKVSKDKSRININESLKNAERYKTMDEHKIGLDELYKRLQTNPETGLTTEKALELGKLHGENRLTEKKKTPLYIKFAKEILSVFALVMWLGALLCFIAYGLNTSDPSNLYLGLVLAIVVLLSGTATFLQNYKSEAIMEGFKNMIPLKVKVLRDGAFSSIFAQKLIPGDIIELKEGDRIPADLRVISCTEMRVDNSSLTGESDPLLRIVECTNPDNPLETKNLCFFGTLCKQGTCKGVILNIGDKTIIGQIAHLTTTAAVPQTPLQKEMDHFVHIIAIIAIVIGLFFFAMGFPLGYDVVTNVIFAIGLIVANVPEGLLMTITVSLALCAKSLSTKSVLAKNLQSVETLGSTTTICSDKTGTLTQNRMTVENLWFNGQICRGMNKQKYEVDLEKFPELKLSYDIKDPAFRILQESAVISSEATFDLSFPQDKLDHISHIKDPKKQSETRTKMMEDWKKAMNTKLWLDKPTIGDASETAIIKFFQPIEDIEITRQSHPLVKHGDIVCRVPFNSINKFALSIVECERLDSHYCIYIKGAPERIWKFCNKILIKENEEHINQNWQNIFDETNEYFANAGQRVLGFAKIHLPATRYPKGYIFNTEVVGHYPDFHEWNFSLSHFTFIGLISLIDPPRDAVPFSINKCKTAGIKVIMVTGDQPITAAAIAKQVNIFDLHTLTNLDIQRELKCSTDEAIMRADSIVIHGDLITEATREDDLLPESEKGRKIGYWLSKKQIVFARTSPAQKLIIVKECQKKGDIVAVTGDGVNDSPAIKKADIGIAMGLTGSDVAKDAADMVLLTDDFSALVLGVEEGRKLFDNLKKSISYTLTSNMPETFPFIFLIIFQMPLAVTTVLLLCIDLGTDIFPAVSFAYEEAELDIMIRKPRDQHERLVSRKLIASCYGQIGIFEVFGGYLAFFTILSNFGIPMESVLWLSFKNGYLHEDTDIYNPYDPYFGNSKLKGACDPQTNTDKLANGEISTHQLDWIFSGDPYADLRMSYVKCARDSQGRLTGGLIPDFIYTECQKFQINPTTLQPVCFRAEAMKYAQTGYFISIVMNQWANVYINKTRRSSVFYHGIKNYYMLWGLAAETLLCLTMSYLPVINTVLNTRDVDFIHFGVLSLPFSVFILIYDEVRKYLMAYSLRNVKDGEKPGWWYRNCAW